MMFFQLLCFIRFKSYPPGGKSYLGINAVDGLGMEEVFIGTKWGFLGLDEFLED